MDKKVDKIRKESILLQIKLRFYQNREKGTEDYQDKPPKPKSVIII